jgi:predicted amidohydrolase
MHVTVEQLCKPKQRARLEEQLVQAWRAFDRVVARGNYKIGIMVCYKIRTYPIFKLFMCSYTSKIMASFTVPFTTSEKRRGMI